MLIAKRHFVSAIDNTPFGVIAVAVSIFVFAYSTRFGQAPILLFYALWLPILAVAPNILMVGWSRVLPLLLLPAICMLSTLWSDAPQVTLRGAIQYSTTILCGLIAARVLAQQALIAGGLVGIILVLSYSYANGRYAYDAVDGSYAFTGAFGSKNQLGYYASIGIVFSVAAWAVFRMGWFWRALALLVAFWSVYTLSVADSATSTLSILGTLAAVITALVVVRLWPLHRRVVIGLLITCGTVAGIAAWQLGAFDQMLQAFGRDPTLTGRTYLWSEGIAAGSENPLLGLGYYAFWTPGRPHAEQLWEDFYITAKTGFHFHNVLIEAYVALGLVGSALVLLLLSLLVILPVRSLLNRRRTGEAALGTGLAMMFAVRSIVEIDFFTPYTVGSFLVHFLLLQMADQRAAELRELSAGRRKHLRPQERLT